MVGFADETVVGGGESVGARLRSAREAHGLSLDDIATRTRVPTRHLKAIEEDAFDQLPAAPYSVGFAKAFADAVGLNREEIGREFRAEKEGYGAADAGLSYVSDEPGPSGSGGIVRIALILVIIAAIAFGLWKSGIFGGSAPVVAPPVVAPPAAPQSPAGQPALPPAVPDAQAPTSSSDENTNQAEETSSRPKQGDEQKEESGRPNRRNGASSDESGTSQSSTNQSEPAAVATPEPPKTTRQLNEEALKPAAPAPAAPPVITPPPPAETPAAPAATP